jgi:uncharacterized protein YggE
MVHQQTWNRRQALSGLRAGATLAVAGAAMPAFSNVAMAQEDATPVAGAVGVPTVSVSGHGSVNVPPDTASVTIGVDIIKPTLTDAQTEAANQVNSIIEALKSAGIAAEDIQTAYFSVNILRDYSENADPTLITGFEVINQLQVTVRDTNTLGDLLDASINAGANSIYGVNFYVDDQTAAASEARIMAVEDARAKAEELASAAGMSLGPVVAISEGTVPVISPVYARGGGMAMDAAAMPIEAGSTTVAVDVQVTYELRG